MDIDYIKNILKYDQSTGFFVWKVSPSRSVKMGEQAGTIDGKGYVRICIKGVSNKAHRLAWAVVYGELPAMAIDHINRVPSDNRILNLRLATCSQNVVNSKIRANNTSGIRGVSWDKKYNKWKVQIAGKHIGYFNSLTESKQMYTKVRLEKYKEFA